VLFTGHADLNIDAKSRLAIPAKIRAQWSEERDGQAWVLVPWPGGVIRVYTERAFQDLAESRGATLTPESDEAELEAALFGSAERVEPDSAGRITLPKQHLQLTGLSGEVVLVGARNRFEIRDRARWLAEEQERFNSLPALVSRVERQKRDR